MDVLKLRRKAATYGKSNKRLPLHNIFDVATASPDPDSIGESSVSLSRGTSVSRRVGTEEVNPSGKHTSFSTREVSDISIPDALSAGNSSDSSPVSSPKSNSRIASHSASPSLFEIESSDEESRGPVGEPVSRKRRKLANSPKITEVGREVTHKQSKHAPENSQSLQQAVRDYGTKPSKKQVPTLGEGFRPNSHVRDLNPKRSVAQQSRLETSSKIHGGATTPDEDSVVSRPTTPGSMESQPPSLHFPKSSTFVSDSETAIPPAANKAQTPMGKRLLQTKDANKAIVPSPSQLKLKSLSLTPERSHSSIDETTAATEIYTTQLTPRRGRQRLVDRLDSPRKLSRQGVVDPGNSLDALPLGSREDTFQSRTDVSTGPSERSASRDRDTSGHSTKELSLPARTYAKERSHLSDMVIEDPGLPPAPVAQDPVSFVASQESTYQSLKSQLELEDSDSDDPAAGGNVRSIHELRQAGANNRFERELESLLEDIDPESSVSKGLRLQALLQLITKLEGEVFAQRFVDAGMTTRLTAMAGKEIDILSAVLVVSTLILISWVDRIGPESLKRILQTLQNASSLLLRDTRSLCNIAKDRKQNLSKSLARELSSFEPRLLSDMVWDKHPPHQLTPQIILLQSLSVITLRMHKTKDVGVAMSASTFHELLCVLNNSSHEVHRIPERPDALLTTELIISVLERWCPLNNALQMIEEKDSLVLGQALTRVLHYASQEHDGLEQAALRVVVNLSNNKSRLSKVLASTAITGAVFEVVKGSFSKLADAADQGEDFDKPKLDSVMLALGCLLNLADSNVEARQNMMELSDGANQSPVDWLVATFNDHFGKATEATTFDQSQVLVAFGYLSMLLCSLCLDDAVRPYALTKLNGGSLKELCLAGDIFFIQLKRVEGINPDDEEMSRFTEHFGGILDAVKQHAS